MTQFGKRLIKGLEEAVAIAKGEATPAKVYADVDVAKIRAKLKNSAKANSPTSWTPGAAYSLLKVAQKEPAAVRRALAR